MNSAHEDIVAFPCKEFYAALSANAKSVFKSRKSEASKEYAGLKVYDAITCRVGFRSGTEWEEAHV